MRLHVLEVSYEVEVREEPVQPEIQLNKYRAGGKGGLLSIMHGGSTVFRKSTGAGGGV